VSLDFSTYFQRSPRRTTCRTCAYQEHGAQVAASSRDSTTGLEGAAGGVSKLVWITQSLLHTPTPQVMSSRRGVVVSHTSAPIST
jgi:hypothetical protein